MFINFILYREKKCRKILKKSAEKNEKQTIRQVESKIIKNLNNWILRKILNSVWRRSHFISLFIPETFKQLILVMPEILLNNVLCYPKFPNFFLGKWYTDLRQSWITCMDKKITQCWCILCKNLHSQSMQHNEKFFRW